MDFSAEAQAIATRKSNCSRAKNENHCPGDIQSRIAERNRRRVEDALADGSDYWRLSLKMPRLTFKTWLESIGKTLTEARKYIRLFETFRDFSLEQIERISLTTLFSLCQKRYQQLIAKLRSLPPCTEVEVQLWLEEQRKAMNAQKPEPKPKTGLISIPGGGRAYQFPLLHDDEAIAKVLQIQKNRNVTPVQILKDAIALLFEKTPGVSWRELAGYNLYARGHKECDRNMEILPQYKQVIGTSG